MIKYAFIARCADEALPLEVAIDYKPGNQNQRARRVAVGQLLAILETESATIDASGSELVSVTTPNGTWVIAEASGGGAARGSV